MSKLVKACIGLAAFVALAVVPASAFAFNDPLVVHQNNTTKVTAGHKAEERVKVTGTSIGPILMTDAETGTLVSCDTAHLEGDLETNTGIGSGTGTVEGTIRSAKFEDHGPKPCTSALAGNTTVTTTVGNGVPWCVVSNGAMATDEVQIRGGECTAEPRGITFVLDTTNIGTCNYSRAAAVKGTYTTHPEDLKVTITHVEFVKESGSGIFCPSKGFIDMTITLETTNGEALSILNQ